MNSKLIHAAIVAGYLAGTVVSSRAQTTPSSSLVLPPPEAVMMRTGGAIQGFQFVGGEPPLSTQVVKGLPYMLEATIETVQTLADGNRILHRQTVHLYRDSSGRTRREETLAAIGPWAASGTPPTMVTIQDPVSGVSYFLDPQQKVATKLPSIPKGQGVSVMRGGGDGPVTGTVGAAPVDAGFVASGGEGTGMVFGFHTDAGGQVLHSEEKSEGLGKENIAGVSADGTRTTTTIPANAIGNERALDIVREKWYSSDLQIVLRSKQEDPRFGETSYEVTKLERVEPTAALFEVPSDYTIRKGEARVVVRSDRDSK
jgi:hypothetical protein